MGSWGMGTPVEIEFAVNMKKEPKEFGFLQMRPLLTRFDSTQMNFSNISDDPLATKDTSFSYWYMTTNSEGSGKEFKLGAKLEDEDIEMKNDGGNSDDYYEKFSTGGSSINLNN